MTKICEFVYILSLSAVLLLLSRRSHSKALLKYELANLKIVKWRKLEIAFDRRAEFRCPWVRRDIGPWKWHSVRRCSINCVISFTYVYAAKCPINICGIHMDFKVFGVVTNSKNWNRIFDHLNEFHNQNLSWRVDKLVYELLKHWIGLIFIDIDINLIRCLFQSFSRLFRLATVTLRSIVIVVAEKAKVFQSNIDQLSGTESAVSRRACFLKSIKRMEHILRYKQYKEHIYSGVYGSRVHISVRDCNA